MLIRSIFSKWPFHFFVCCIDIRLSRETMEIAPWKSVCGGTAAPSVAVEPDPRAAGPVAVAAREDGVVRRRWPCTLKSACSSFFPLLLSPLLWCLDGRLDGKLPAAAVCCISTSCHHTLGGHIKLNSLWWYVTVLKTCGMLELFDGTSCWYP